MRSPMGRSSSIHFFLCHGASPQAYPWSTPRPALPPKPAFLYYRTEVSGAGAKSWSPIGGADIRRPQMAEVDARSRSIRKEDDNAASETSDPGRYLPGESDHHRWDRAPPRRGGGGRQGDR